MAVRRELVADLSYATPYWVVCGLLGRDRCWANNQSLQVLAEALRGLLGGALAAAVVKLPLLVFAGAAIAGALVLFQRPSARWATSR